MKLSIDLKKRIRLNGQIQTSLIGGKGFALGIYFFYDNKHIAEAI